MLDLDPQTFITRIIILVVAFSIHELAHALTATYFGDNTPRLNGRLTLNPLAHLDPIGSLLMIVQGFGWAKPVPVNPYALQRHSPSAMMWVSLAGPASNLALALLAAIPFWIGLTSLDQAWITQSGWLPTPARFLAEWVFTNLLLMFFNLLPIAPLDGEKVATYLFPAPVGRFLEQIRPYGPMILLAVLFLGPSIGLDFFGWVIMPPLQALFGLLVG